MLPSLLSFSWSGEYSMMWIYVFFLRNNFTNWFCKHFYLKIYDYDINDIINVTLWFVTSLIQFYNGYKQIETAFTDYQREFYFLFSAYYYLLIRYFYKSVQRFWQKIPFCCIIDSRDIILAQFTNAPCFDRIFRILLNN